MIQPDNRPVEGDVVTLVLDFDPPATSNLSESASPAHERLATNLTGPTLGFARNGGKLLLALVSLPPGSYVAAVAAFGQGSEVRLLSASHSEAPAYEWTEPSDALDALPDPDAIPAAEAALGSDGAGAGISSAGADIVLPPPDEVIWENPPDVKFEVSVSAPVAPNTFATPLDGPAALGANAADSLFDPAEVSDNDDALLARPSSEVVFGVPDSLAREVTSPEDSTPPPRPAALGGVEAKENCKPSAVSTCPAKPEFNASVTAPGTPTHRSPAPAAQLSLSTTPLSLTPRGPQETTTGNAQSPKKSSTPVEFLSISISTLLFIL